jgi:hypothetical protein
LTDEQNWKNFNSGEKTMIFNPTRRTGQSGCSLVGGIGSLRRKKLLILFCKLDHFIAMKHILLIFIKWSSLQKSVWIVESFKGFSLHLRVFFIQTAVLAAKTEPLLIYYNYLQILDRWGEGQKK